MPPSCPDCGTTLANPHRNASGYCRGCYQRRWMSEQRRGRPKQDEGPVIDITPEISTWALITTAFWTEQDWRLVREGLFWDEQVAA